MAFSLLLVSPLFMSAFSNELNADVDVQVLNSEVSIFGSKMLLVEVFGLSLRGGKSTVIFPTPLKDLY